MARSSKRPKVLVADDEEWMRRLLDKHLERGGFDCELAEDGTEAMAMINDSFSVVLLDLQMPYLDGLECLKRIRRKYPRLPVVMLSSQGEAKNAVVAMKEGAMDYLTKPFDPDEVLAVLRQGMKVMELGRENEELKSAVGVSRPRTAFVAESPAMKELLSKMEQLADIDTTLIFTGESGVGKSLLARHVHYASKRAEKPFVSVSCPALPRELLESELFGHEKGAFTGALKRHIGKLEVAKDGTLFLDEVGDLPLDLQPKFLNVLQDREFSRVGGTSVIKSQVRLIAATNVDLRERVASGEFREDLYYRLNVIPLEIPPLRERVEDIVPLAMQILKRIAESRGGAPYELADAAGQLLVERKWPGNVRQLENVLERVSAFCTGTSVSASEMMGVLDAEPSAPADEGSVAGGAPPSLSGMSLAEIEKEAIIQTLGANRGNKARTARQLDISEKSVYNKMKRLGIEG